MFLRHRIKSGIGEKSFWLMFIYVGFIDWDYNWRKLFIKLFHSICLLIFDKIMRHLCLLSSSFFGKLTKLLVTHRKEKSIMKLKENLKLIYFFKYESEVFIILLKKFHVLIKVPMFGLNFIKSRSSGVRDCVYRNNIPAQKSTTIFYNGDQT